MLPPQLRKAVEAAHQTAQQQIQKNQAEDDGRLSTQEYSRLAELQKQRAHLEMRQLQAEAGLLTKTQAQVAAAGLEWLYDDPKNSVEAKEREREAFLLGKPIPNAAPKADESLTQRVAESVTKALPVLLPTQDRLRKLREDPLLLIRQAELAQQQAQEANPLLQLQLKQQMQARMQENSAKEDKKATRKSSKKAKKHHKKSKHKRARSSSSEIDDDRRRNKSDGRRDDTGGRCEVGREGGRSRSRGRDREFSRLHVKDNIHDSQRHDSSRRSPKRYGKESACGPDYSGFMDEPVASSSHRQKGSASSGSPANACNGGSAGDPLAQSVSTRGSGSTRVYGPSLAGAGSAPAPFRVTEELLPPVSIRQKAEALLEAQRDKLLARETVQLQQQAATSDSNNSVITAEKLREMQVEGLRREAEKQRRSQLVQVKEQLEERIEAQRRALLDASEETRGLRPKVFASSSVEPARDVVMKVRKAHKAINDLGASNEELK